MNIEQLRADTKILFERALLKKQISAFGVDGNGEYGQSFWGKQFKISDTAVLVRGHTFPITANVLLSLENYEHLDCGHMLTDKNAEISISALLKDQHIDPTCWTWADLEYQGADFIMITVEIEKLCI